VREITPKNKRVRIISLLEIVLKIVSSPPKPQKNRTQNIIINDTPEEINPNLYLTFSYFCDFAYFSLS
jgi:hypothetical protein